MNQKDRIYNAKLFVLSGPSGVGKNAILAKLLKKIPDLKKVVTCTTRRRRPQEKEGLDHYFVSQKEFQKMIKENRFMEWAYVHKDYYGTLKEIVEKWLSQGKKRIMEIDVQGALQIKKKIPSVVLIFIKPDSFANLFHRIAKRGKMSQADLKIRLEKSYRREMALSKFYDYIIVNREGELNKAVERIKKIIRRG